MSGYVNYRDGKYSSPITYALKHKNYDIRMESRSGGFFTALSDEVLEAGGVVYGCVLNEKLEAIHIRAESAEQRDRMRGSKYVQSVMGDVFLTVKEDLQKGRRVLFSGTSCQVAGLRAFLGKDHENLFCLDIVCHGVPSPLSWQKYLDWQRSRCKKEIVGADFRNKKDFGWADHVETLFLENGKQIDSRVYTTLFYAHAILRPCCYKCPYKDIIHPGNITIADYWGIKKAAPGFDDDKGVSLVMINDDKGKAAFEKVCERTEYILTKIEDSMQPPLRRPFARPENRDQVWDDIHNKPFLTVANRYGGNSLWSRTKRMIRQTLAKMGIHLK